MRRIVTLVFLLACAGALAGCNVDSLLSQWKLRNFSVATADVERIRVALRAPGWAAPTPDKATMESVYVEDGEERRLTIHLRAGSNPADRAQLARIAPAPEQLAIYEISPRDLAAVRALQVKAAAAKAAGGKFAARLEVGAAVACAKTPPPDGPILIDFYVHPDDDIGWLALLERYDLRDMFRTPEARSKLAAGVPPCAKTG